MLFFIRHEATKNQALKIPEILLWVVASQKSAEQCHYQVCQAVKSPPWNDNPMETTFDKRKKSLVKSGKGRAKNRVTVVEISAQN